MWFEKERIPPRSKLGIQWVTPDGVKSKADKVLGFKVVFFLFVCFFFSFSDPLSVGTFTALEGFKVHC